MSICYQCKHRTIDEDLNEDDQDIGRCDVDANKLLWDHLPPWAALFLEKEIETPSDFEKELSCMDFGMKDLQECPCFESL